MTDKIAIPAVTEHTSASKKDGNLQLFGGSKRDKFNRVLINQTLRCGLHIVSDENDQENVRSAILTAMAGIAPKDEVEGMFAAQLIGLHNAAMECLRRGIHPEQTLEGQRENLNLANKLTRSYVSSVEALNRYRGKGQQKVTVEHVHVHAGGQAIVGNITHPKGGGSKKQEEQPHAKQIDHAPVQEMSSPDTQEQPMPIPCNAKR